MSELRDIPEFEGRYAVTMDGRIWSYPKTYIAGRGATYGHSGKWMTATTDKLGYPHVRLSHRKFYVHRAVALAWVPNPRGFPQVNHINGNRADAHAANLEWCDQQHNNRHARASGANPARTPARTAHCRRMRQLQLQRARS
jgi:hypothetical protein